MIEPLEIREPGEDFKFRASVHKVFPSIQDTRGFVQLIASAPKFGLLFVSNRSQLKAFQIKDLVDNNDDRPFAEFELAEGNISHLTVSCDGLTLLLVADIGNQPHLFLFDTKDIASVTPFYFTPLSSKQGAFVTSLSCNPTDPTCVAVAFSTGDLTLLHVLENSVNFTTIQDVGAGVVSWSAKGKQLAVGRLDGSISLHKTDLTPVRTISPPPIELAGPVNSITWFANTEFFIGYRSNNLNLCYVLAPKGQEPKFCNFEDVCYSSEDSKPIIYYNAYVAEWNVLLLLSSHGIEMGILGKSAAKGHPCDWCQWMADEDARATMQFVNVVEETHPLGLCLDLTSQKTFMSKDGKSLGPYPVLFSLSTGGELHVFHVENNFAGSPSLNVPSEPLTQEKRRSAAQYAQRIPPYIRKITEEPSHSDKIAQSSGDAFASIPSNESIVDESGFTSSTPMKPALQPSLTIQPITPSFSPSIAPPTVGVAAPGINQPTGLSFQSPHQAPKQPPAVAFAGGTPSAAVPSPMTSAIPLPTPSTPSTAAAAPTSSADFAPSRTPAAAPVAAPATVAASPTVIKISQKALISIARKEIDTFQAEFSRHCEDNEVSHCQIGTKEEADALCRNLKTIDTLMKDIKSTTGEQNSEVSQLHPGMMDAFAAYEEAKSHSETKKSSKNMAYLQLRPLDPYSKKRLQEIRNKYFYLQSQIMEMNNKLDSEWEEYCVAKKRSSRGTKVTGDALHRSVLHLYNSRVALEKQLGDITDRMKDTLVLVSPMRRLGVASKRNECRKESDFSSNAEEEAPWGTCLAPQKVQDLQKVLSQRNHTPIRNRFVSKFPLKTAAADGDSNASSFPLIEYVQEYEDISPPSSPEKSASATAKNPLAALSSLVGRVDDSVSSNTCAASPATGTQPFSFSLDTSGHPPIASTNGSSSAVGSQVSSVSVPMGSQLDGAQYHSFSQSSKTATTTSIFDSGHIQTSTHYDESAAVDYAKPEGSSLFSFGSVQSKLPAQSMQSSPFAGSSSISFSPLPSVSQLSIFAVASTEASTTLQGTSTDSANHSAVGKSAVLSSNSSKSSATSPSTAPFAPAVSIFSLPSTSPFTKPPFSSASNSLFASTSNSPASSAFSITVSGAPPSFSSSFLSGTASSQPTSTTSASSIFSISSLLTTSVSTDSPVVSSAPHAAISTGTSIDPKTSSSFLVSSNNESSTYKSIFGNSGGLAIEGKPAFGASGGSSLFGGSMFNSGKPPPVPVSSSEFKNDEITSTEAVAESELPLKVADSTAATVFSITAGTPSATTCTSDSGSVTSSVATTASSAFGSPASSSLFGNKSLFQNIASNIAGGSIFGNAAVSTASGTSLFGGSSSTASTFNMPATIAKASVFDEAPSSTVTGTFGSINPSDSATFGAPVSGSTASFGVAISSVSSAFGIPLSGATTSTTAQSSFGLLAPSTATSAFGVPAASTSTTTATITPASVFSVPGSSSIFGAPASGASASSFGAPSSAIISTFGMPASTTSTTITTTTTSIFGTAAGTSIFGAPPPITTASSFAITTSSSVFGGAPGIGSGSGQSIFGASAAKGGVFGESATASNFGSTASDASLPAFGSGQGVFGSSANAGKSIFGGTPTSVGSSSVFGASSSVPGSTGSVFGGGTPANTGGGGIFGNSQTGSNWASNSAFGQASATSAASIFSGGGAFSGLGGAPSKENASKNVFGSVTASNPPSTSLFGNQSSTPFGAAPQPQESTTPASPFGGGASSSFSPIKSSSGGGFGAAATFGGTPSFGSKFGGPAIFGGTSTFGGSPGGSGGGGGGGFSSFASTGAAASSFGALAGTAQTPSVFGNQPQESASFGGGVPQPPSTAAFGSPGLSGQSFTSWRS